MVYHLVEHRQYGSLGNPTGTTAADFVCGFTGRPYDAATGCLQHADQEMPHGVAPQVGRYPAQAQLTMRIAG